MISKCWTENPVNQRERKKIIEQETQTKEGHLKTATFFLFCFSSSKNNAQLVPQYLKKLKTLQNISFVYIYMYIYIYLYIYIYIICFFHISNCCRECVSGCWRPGEIPEEPQSETQTQVELFWKAMAALDGLKHTMHMILASLSVHIKDSMQPCLPHSHTVSTIETNRKRAWLRNVSPLDVQLSVEHPPLPDSLLSSRGAGRVCVCASSPFQGVSASKANFCPCSFLRTPTRSMI